MISDVKLRKVTFLLQSVTKIMGKTAFWITSCFYPHPPLNKVEKQWEKLASSYVMGSQHCIRAEGGRFKIPIIFCHWLSEIYQKNKKDDVLCLLFHIIQICFNEPDYFILHSIMNIMTKNCARMTHKILHQ